MRDIIVVVGSIPEHALASALEYDYPGRGSRPAVVRLGAREWRLEVLDETARPLPESRYRLAAGSEILLPGAAISGGSRSAVEAVVGQLTQDGQTAIVAFVVPEQAWDPGSNDAIYAGTWRQSAPDAIVWCWRNDRLEVVSYP